MEVRLQLGLGKGWGSFWKAEVLSGEVTKLPPPLTRPWWVLAAEAGREQGPEFRLVYSVKFTHRVGAYRGLWGLPDSLVDFGTEMVLMGTPGRRGAALESHL